MRIALFSFVGSTDQPCWNTNVCTLIVPSLCLFISTLIYFPLACIMVRFFVLLASSHIKSSLQLCVQIFVMSLLLAPLRFVAVMVSLVLAYIFSSLGLWGISREELSARPLTGWRGSVLD